MKKRKGRKVRRAVFTLVNIAVPLTFLLLLWTYSVEEKVRYTPDYPKQDISDYLERRILTEEEYELLYRQTGLKKQAVDTLRRENREEEILAAQERYFAKVETKCEADFLLSGEVLVRPGKLVVPVLEDGDILLTFNSHFLGWRNGHVAIVVDAEKGLALEALMLGKDSAILPVSSWRKYPSFVVMRLTGASEEERAAVAEYAEKKFAELPYRLSAGVWDRIYIPLITNQRKVRAGNVAEDNLQTELSGTNCSHMVWCAYRQFGYDLDSDGGLIVTPRDLYESPLLEIVQVYGVEPE